MTKDAIQTKLQYLRQSYSHPPYDLETKLLDEMANCWLEQAVRTMDEINELEPARLSTNPLRSKKNSLIAWCTLFTRTAIKFGVDYDEAYSLNDRMVRRIDGFAKLSELQQYEYELIGAYVKLIEGCKYKKYNYPVSKIVKYIGRNIMTELSVTSLGSVFELNADYLSKLFHDEVGDTLIHYIQAQKVKIAESYLIHSELTITEISEELGFSSSAYFSRVYKKHKGSTPTVYRRCFK